MSIYLPPSGALSYDHQLLAATRFQIPDSPTECQSEIAFINCLTLSMMNGAVPLAFRSSLFSGSNELTSAVKCLTVKLKKSDKAIWPTVDCNY